MGTLTKTVCPECGHDDRDRTSWLDRLLNRFGRVRVFECPHAVDTMMDNCGCTNTKYHRPLS